jgi:hypothetical protein
LISTPMWNGKVKIKHVLLLNGMPTSIGVWFFKMPLILFHYSHDMRKIKSKRVFSFTLCKALVHMWYRAEHRRNSGKAHSLRLYLTQINN